MATAGAPVRSPAVAATGMAIVPARVDTQPTASARRIIDLERTSAFEEVNCSGLGGIRTDCQPYVSVIPRQGPSRPHQQLAKSPQSPAIESAFGTRLLLGDSRPLRASLTSRCCQHQTEEKRAAENRGDGQVSAAERHHRQPAKNPDMAVKQQSQKKAPAFCAHRDSAHGHHADHRSANESGTYPRARGRPGLRRGPQRQHPRMAEHRSGIAEEG